MKALCAGVGIVLLAAIGSGSRQDLIRGRVVSVQTRPIRSAGATRRLRMAVETLAVMPQKFEDTAAQDLVVAVEITDAAGRRHFGEMIHRSGQRRRGTGARTYRVEWEIFIDVTRAEGARVTAYWICLKARAQEEPVCTDSENATSLEALRERNRNSDALTLAQS